MNQPKRSLPITKRDTMDSIRNATGELTKQSSILSNDSEAYRQYSSPPSSKLETARTSQKTKKSIRLSDLMAAMYPGVKIGHKYCVQRVMFVPKTMGWLWNTEDTATGAPFPRGWRPGAIALGVKKRFFRQRSTTETLNTPIGLKGKKYKRKIKTTSSTILKSRTASFASTTEKPLPPPTLCVKKEGGVYRVMMQPIKHFEAKDNTPDEQPVQFQIAENSNSSYSRTTRSSSSSLQIEYMCTGALRKPVIKPQLTEIGTQWDTLDFEKKEPEKKEVILEEPKKTKKKGKKKSKASGDETKSKSAKEETKVDNLVDEKKEEEIKIENKKPTKK